MIKVYTPKDYDFNYKECKKLFKKYRDKIQGTWEFKDAINKSLFFSFFDDDKFIGCIFYYWENERLNVCAFAHRHQHLKNIECFKMSLDWFNCDIYAESVQKPAILCLLRCGFKKISDNTYKYERSKKIW